MVRRCIARVSCSCLLAAGGCGASPAPQPAPPAKAPPPTATQPAPAITLPTPPPSFRLPTTVRPTHNTVALAVDPGSEDFTGTITTELAIAEPMSTIWLNGDEIDVDTATIDQAGTSQSASVAKDGKDLIGISVPHPPAAGAATMTIKYRGKVHVGDGDGIYRYQEGGDWYAVTQFEIADARQAFPTFDEPSFKVPWQLTLTIKASLTAVSNTPSTSDHDNGDGTRTVTFAETRPLPSYLVAFAVGPFELVDAGKTARGVPVRIVVPRGRARDAAYPVKVSAELVDRLEGYFGTPYPYPKLDLVAIAVLDHGAMENAGMITFNEPLVLTPPAELTRGKQESYATVATHEMAHQWFGDLVTLAWWDDTWLNESFAQWMEAKLVDAWKPEWELGVDLVDTKSGVMADDSLDSARAIYQPIKNRGDILNAFDGITYQKGEAVLTMIERHVGEAVFRTGVRDYLAKHAFSNATYDDFVASMSSAAGRDVRPLFDSFVKQSGIPYVSATLSCAPNQPPRLALAQARYAPTGSQMAAGDRTRTWTIPMCVEWSAGGPGHGQTGRDCTVLDQPTGELALSAKTCPAWVLPNEGELAYYRPRLAGADLDHLLAHGHDLTVAERVGLVGDVAALVQSGDASNAVALGLVADLARGPEPAHRRRVDRHRRGHRRDGAGRAARQLRAADRQALQGARPRARLGRQAGRGRRPQAAAADAARAGRGRGQGPAADRRGDPAGVEVVRRPRRDPARAGDDGARDRRPVRQPGAVRQAARGRQGGEGPRRAGAPGRRARRVRGPQAARPEARHFARGRLRLPPDVRDAVREPGGAEAARAHVRVGQAALRRGVGEAAEGLQAVHGVRRRAAVRRGDEAGGRGVPEAADRAAGRRAARAGAGAGAAELVRGEEGGADAGRRGVLEEASDSPGRDRDRNGHERVNG